MRLSDWGPQTGLTGLGSLERTQDSEEAVGTAQEVPSSSAGPLGQASQGVLGDGYLLLRAEQEKINRALGSVSGHQLSSGAFQTAVCGQGGSRGGEGRSKKARRKDRRSRAEKSKWKEKGEKEKGRDGGAGGGARRG